MSQEIEESVIKKIRERRDVGRKKYGTTMEREDLSILKWLQHAQEEAMDLAIYLEKLIRDIEKEPTQATTPEEFGEASCSAVAAAQSGSVHPICSPWCDGCGKNRLSRIGKTHQLAKVSAPFYLCRYCRASETRKANRQSNQPINTKHNEQLQQRKQGRPLQERPQGQRQTS